VGELVALAKVRPLNYGSVGIGNTTQLVMEMFSRAANIRMTHVPYKGGAQAITAVAGGEVQLVFLPPTVALPHIKGGRLKAIAFSGSTRLANLPEVPTVAESGLPGFHRDSGFNAWFAPARTSPRILATLADEVRRALGVPRVKEVFIAGGYEPVGNTPAEAKAYLRDQVKDYGEIVRAIGLEPN
jgi:tripartite-type tricarboxylate transporter receptor subunit TctC